MSNSLTIFDQPRANLPSHITSFFGEESNITEQRTTVPSLSYEGKVWTINLNGEKTRLMKQDENGDETAIQIMRVVVLDYAKNRGRTYYEGAYDPAKPGTPLCWSDDGITPHAAVQSPQASRCDGCPMAVKGSKITDQGKAIAACSQHRMIAVVPANKLDFTPLRMKIAITSDWDKNEELAAQGWFAFKNYTDMLRAKGVQHTAALVTKMKFDPSTAYPKVLFSPDRWLEAAEIERVKPVTKSDEVKALLGGTWTPAGVDGAKIAAPTPAPAKAAPAPVAADDEDEIVIPVAKPKAAAPVIDLDEEEIIEVVTPKKAAAKTPKKVDQPVAAKPAAATTSVSDDVAALLDEWGD